MSKRYALGFSEVPFVVLITLWLFLLHALIGRLPRVMLVLIGEYPCSFLCLVLRGLQFQGCTLVEKIGEYTVSSLRYPLVSSR